MDDLATIRVMVVDGTAEINVDAIAPAIADAVSMATDYLAGKWRHAAAHGIGGLKPTGNAQYHQGIAAGVQYPYGGNQLSGWVVNEASSAKRVEDGYPSFDMKPGLLSGPQARRGKNGMYNVVPFRWGTPRQSGMEAGDGDDRATLNTMPDDIYDLVREFEQSKVTDSYLTPAWSMFAYRKSDDPRGGGDMFMGASRRVYKYQWGDQLKVSDIPPELSHPTMPHHSVSLYAGMVRMKADEGTRHTHSQYMTFRVVSANSRPGSWIHPGVEARPFSKLVIEEERENVKRLILAAAKGATGGGT